MNWPTSVWKTVIRYLLFMNRSFEKVLLFYLLVSFNYAMYGKMGYKFTFVMWATYGL